jgi:UDP-N-acetylglucosamine transferase subunit ALG13
MAVTQRTQYLYGKTVVDVEQEQGQSATVERTKSNLHAELRQAEYYQELLDELRTELVVELAHLHASQGASRTEHVIAAKEAELTEIDRLTAALHARFSTSRLASDDPESLRRIAV